MPSKVAFGSDGTATATLLKRLEKENATKNQLERRREGDTEYVFLNQTVSGLGLPAALQMALDKALAALPVPKKMRYQIPRPSVSDIHLEASTSERRSSYAMDTVEFVRPAHGLVALHGENIVKVTALGLEADRVTRGHRVLSDKPLVIRHAEDYERVLREEGKVEASYITRRERVKEELQRAEKELARKAGQKPDGRIPVGVRSFVIDTERAEPVAHIFPQSTNLEASERAVYCSGGSDLVDEVTALVEWPKAYWGQFDKKFLELPIECLALTMKQHQKYFPVFNSSADLLPYFVIVANNDHSIAGNAETIRRNIESGNERVLRPRLTDARFFFEQDKKTRLEKRVPKLADVVFHNKLGSQLERTERIQLLAGRIARDLNANVALAERASWLCKADLLSGMVGEFPELQGVMGRYYAVHDGEDEIVANAIEAHYRPRFAGDRLPDGSVACAVALADKLDTLVGMFSIGNAPTGERDPFGLRRQALGVVRILLERKLPLDLLALLIDARVALLPSELARGLVGKQAKWVDEQVPLEVLTFIFDRMRGYLKDIEFKADEIEAVLSQTTGRIDLIPIRLEAVREFKKLPEAESLAAANKRIRNILKKAPQFDSPKFPQRPWENPAEAALFNALQKVAPRVHKHFGELRYKEALVELAALKSPVDRFFEEVMVMVDDPDLRNSRLDLLRTLDGLMNQVADLSRLAA